MGFTPVSSKVITIISQDGFIFHRNKTGRSCLKICWFSKEEKYSTNCAALGPSFGHLSLRKAKAVKQHQRIHVQWHSFDFVTSQLALTSHFSHHDQRRELYKNSLPDSSIS